MSESKREILVTSALPYANGPLHLGHMVEHIQSDVWVKFQRMLGNECYFVCGEDAHGTPMMLAAEKLGILPEELAAKYQAEHSKDIQDFNVDYDCFHTTHSAENLELATEIYLKLQQRGDIVTKTIEQAYDPEKNIFLPDRYVKGTCSKCGAEDQYGDGCEVCGAHYTPMELKNPVSAISGAKPITKTSEHYFFCLDNYKEMLSSWIKQDHMQPEITNKLQEWFATGLKQWDISRDHPYFGFKIPGAKDKYFYVWLDAPIGYMASFKKLCEQIGEDKFLKYWQHDSTTELYHFIGKDIVYFHALFWPAILTGANLRKPSRICVHGFLTVDGEKMSKSRGTFITARQYLDKLNPEYLRYYFTSKLSNGVDDIDFNFEDFVQRVNSDLVGKYANIASRCAGFLRKNFANTLADNCYDAELYQKFVVKGEEIAQLFETRRYNKAIREIMALADEANRFIDHHKPWVLIKDPTKAKLTHDVCSLGINLFRVLTIYLKPVLPAITKEAEQYLNVSNLVWSDIEHPLWEHKLNEFKPLICRIEQQEVTSMLESVKKETEQKETVAASAATAGEVEKSADAVQADLEPIAETISIDDFMKIDLRVAKIVEAEAVTEARKLLKLTVDIGAEKRQVFAGIKSAYEPEQLVGKLVVVVANLAPRKMKFGLSSGMVLAAGSGGKELWVIEPNEHTKPGMRIK